MILDLIRAHADELITIGLCLIGLGGLLVAMVREARK
jgi:hypothetical protein